MSDYSWIGHMVRTEDFAISPKLHWLLAADSEAIRPYALMGEEHALLHLASLQQQFPTLKSVPFAWRLDRDDIYALALQDPVYKRGQVILFDIDDPDDYVIEEAAASLDAWANEAWATIERCRSSWQK